MSDEKNCLKEIMEWVVRYTTIKEEEGRDEGAGQYHVSVRFNPQIMTFDASPDETYMSFKRRVATRINRSEYSFKLLYNGVAVPDVNWTLERWGIQSGQILTSTVIPILN